MQHPSCGEKTEEQGERYAEQSYHHAGDAYLFELFEVGVEPCGEHDEDDAYLGKEGEPLHRGGGEDLLPGDVTYQSEQYTCDYHPHHLRQPYLFAEDGEKFCHHKYQRKRQKQFVYIHHDLPWRAPRARVRTRR